MFRRLSWGQSRDFRPAESAACLRASVVAFGRGRPILVRCLPLLIICACPSAPPGFRNSQPPPSVSALLCPDTATVTAAVSQFTKPGDDWANRLQVNATYYKGNYSIIFFSFLLYSIIANPFLLMSILILTGSWTFLLSGRPRLEDGSLAPLNIGGRVLTAMEQKAALGVGFRACRFSAPCTGLLHALQQQQGRGIIERKLLERWVWAGRPSRQLPVGRCARQTCGKR